MKQFMEGQNRLRGFLVGLGLALLTGAAAAEEVYYGDRPEVRAFIDEVVAAEGFQRDDLATIFAGAVRKDSILEAIARPAEKTKPWYEYRDIFVTEKRAGLGLEFYHRHANTLQRAERQFGVPAEIITAIIGVETFYGRNKGSFRVIDALSTLAFDYPPRAEFFRSELKQFLLMTREQGLPVDELKGSYAGAMGYGQFIASSWRNYAVDFDGDGVVDIIDNPVDAIGSVANYFKRHRWRPGLPVTARARVADGYRREWMNDGLKPTRSLAVLATGGIHPTVQMAPDTLATVMAFEGEDGEEFWLGWHNFYVITRYNHSSMYAMSVYQLSEVIGERL
jgi:membrane-bound lytic murein transglycosylase B